MVFPYLVRLYFSYIGTASLSADVSL